jgi:hypothetical protein
MSDRPTVLPAAVGDAVLAAIARRASDAGPVPLVFATGNFARLLDNWLAHAGAACVRQPLVIAMDRALSLPAGSDALLVPYSFDGSLSDLWFRRALVFEFLSAHGVDFIHSDVDAVWLQDARPLCFAENEFDLVFSQGGAYPEEIWRRWGFVLCCGLFAARANANTAAFFAKVRALAEQIPDDQVAVNALLEQHGISWKTAGHETYPLQDRRGRTFTAYRQMLEGTCEALGLRIGLIPHHRLPRLAIAGTDAVARHPLGPGDPAQKAEILRAVGCWKLD